MCLVKVVRPFTACVRQCAENRKCRSVLDMALISYHRAPKRKVSEPGTPPAPGLVRTISGSVKPWAEAGPVVKVAPLLWLVRRADLET